MIKPNDIFQNCVHSCSTLKFKPGGWHVLRFGPSFSEVQITGLTEGSTFPILTNDLVIDYFFLSIKCSRQIYAISRRFLHVCLDWRYVAMLRCYVTSLNWKSSMHLGESKIEKVPREWDIKGEKSGKSRQVPENWSKQFEHKQVPKGTEPVVWKDKLSLLACHDRCKYSMETTCKSAKVKLGIDVIKLVKCLISWENTVTDRVQH